MSFIGYKVTLFLLNNLWLCKLFAVVLLFFCFFCGKGLFIRKRIVQKKIVGTNWHAGSALTT